MSSSLGGPKAKIERTKTQIKELNQKINAFLRGNGYAVESKINVDRDEETWSFKLKRDIPEEFSVMAGEILHNLRSSLDNLACEVAFQHSGSFKETYFAFGADANVFESQLSSKGKKLPADALDMIRALQPYKGGNDLLWAIHDANRRDKHVSLKPVNVHSVVNITTKLTIVSGWGLTWGSRSGQHLNASKPRPSAAEIAAMPSPVAVLTSGGVAMHFGTAGCTPDQSREFFTGVPGTKFQTDMRPTFNVALSDVEGFELEPAIAVLNQMRDLVHRVVLTFEKRFF